MAEQSYVWDSGAGGDASPHSEALTALLFAAVFGTNASANLGVAAGRLNELAPTLTGGATTITVNTGWACVDGHPYSNDASKVITPVTPAVGTTGRRLVLRADWSAQTVRIVEISSADGTATIPAPTQASGTTYEIPICSYTVTTGGAIAAFNDERAFSSSVPSLARQLTEMLKANTEELLVYSDFASMPPAGGSIDIGFKTLVGTPTQSATADETSIRMAPATSSNIAIGTQYSDAAVPDQNPYCIMIMGSDATATPANNLHTLFGFWNSYTIASPTGAYLRKETTGNWFFVTDGGSEETTDLGFADFSGGEVVEIYTPDAGVTWYCAIDGAQVAQHGTQVPAAATGLYVGLGCEAGGGGGFTTQGVDAMAARQDRN